MVRRIRNVQREDCAEFLAHWLSARFGLDADHAREAMRAPLPEGYSRLGETATRNILAHLQAEVLTYNQAVEACGWHHSNERTGEVLNALPYSRTLDDSFANRTLCLKEANREKRNKTPWEAWGSDADRWAKIEANLKNLPENKRWRFAPDAMQRFEGENDFTSRALNDTAYLSRIAKAYLEALYTEGGHVWVVPGRLTEMLRRHWGLNFRFGAETSMAKAKNRHDHRHHAIDAAVIAATDRGLIQKIARLSEDNVEQNREALAEATPPPWGEAKQALARLIALDLPLGGVTSPVSVALARLATSLALSFESGKLTLALPAPPDALTLKGLGQ